MARITPTQLGSSEHGVKNCNPDPEDLLGILVSATNPDGTPFTLPVEGAATGVAQNVEFVAATPTAITDTATVAATRYVGISVAETAGATAKVRVRNGTVAGVILDTLTLAANESVSYEYAHGRLVASGSIYLQVVSGTIEGSVFSL